MIQKLFLAGVLAALNCVAFAQDAAQPEQYLLPFAPSESGPHHTTWTQTNELGEVTSQYTELASGLNYWSSELNGWTPTVEGLELRQDGSAEFLKGAYHVRLASNLNNPNGAVTISFGQDRTYTLQTIGLVYTEATTGRSVFIAEMKDSTGRATGLTQWTWADAFDGISASVQASVRAGSFQNDVVIFGQIPPPGDFGLDAAVTRLEVWHQVIDGPEPVVDGQSIVRKDGVVEPDARLYMADGFMMGNGTAFPIPANANQPAREGIPVGKEWFKDAATGLRFLIEGVPYTDARDHLAALPGHAEARVDRNALNKAWAAQQKKGKNRPVQVASWKSATAPVRQVSSVIQKEQKGFLIDYTIVNTITNYTFKGDVTYFVNQPVTISGKTIMEGGSVIKMATTNSLASYVCVYDNFDCQTDGARPAIFTDLNDNSVGDTLPGASGSPTCCSSDRSLWFIATNKVDVHDLQVRYANIGLNLWGTATHNVRNVQFRNYRTGVESYSTTNSLSNLLFVDGGTPLEAYGTSTNIGVHWTIHNAGSHYYNSGSSVLTLTNCLLVNVTNLSGLSTNLNVVVGILTNTFQTVLAGAHYLPSNSTYLDGGTTNIDATLAASLAQMTVLPPTVYSGYQTVNLTLSPATRDPGLPALGYHYPATDYIFDGLSVSNNVTVTLTNGVALAVSSVNGVVLKAGSTFRSKGRADNLNHFGGTVAVQEQLVTGTATPLLKIDAYNSSRPTVDVRFTDIAVVAGTDTQRTFLAPRLDWIGLVTLRDSFLRGAIFKAGDTYPNSPVDNCTGIVVGLTNNVFDRAVVEFHKTYNAVNTYFTAHLWQNTFSGGKLIFYAHTASGGYNTLWYVKDNLFDATAITKDSPANLSAGYNGYRSASSLGGSSNVTVTTNFTFSTPSSGLGRWYHGNNELKDYGSRTAANAGMYHYTTQSAKEGSSQVDIGFHYVYTTIGKPFDDDSDGLPDYLEDANGNGSVDTGETDPSEPDVDYDGRMDGEEVFTDGTNPLDPNSVVKVRLASWSFNTNTFKGDQGQVALVSSGVNYDTNNWSRGAASFGETNFYLKYKDVEDTGKPNINFRNGSVRFWYKPNNVGNANTNNYTFITGGHGGPEPNGWSFGRYWLSNTLGFSTVISNIPGNTNATTSVSYFGNTPGAIVQWNTNRWYQLTLTYSATNVAVYVNGTNLPITSYDQRPIMKTNWANPADTANQNDLAYLTRGAGLYSYPNAASRAYNGIQIGSYANGLMDQIETFNYPLSAQEVAAGYPNFWGDVLTPMSDYDYDGRSDWLEITDNISNTNGDLVGKTRLGYFRFNSDLQGEQGQSNIVANSYSLVNSWSGSALSIGSSASSRVVYKDVETNGWANFNCRTGAVRFWFNPQWSGTPGHTAPLLRMGSASDYWSLQVNSSGNAISLVSCNSSTATTVLSGSMTLTNGNWYHITLNYGSTGTALYVNGNSLASSGGYSFVVPLNARTNGLVIGNNTAATANCQGLFEELETFNYNLSTNEIFESFEALHRLDGNLNGVLDIAEEVTLDSNQPSQPFLGRRWSITGVIEAEHFDVGGVGVGYGTNGIANATNAYRISKMSITNADDMGGGYCLADLRVGDWLNYSVNVSGTNQTYVVELRSCAPTAANATNGAIKVEFLNGATVIATKTLVATNGGWTNLISSSFALANGNLTMRVSVATNSANTNIFGRLNYISVYPMWDTSVPVITTPVSVTGLVATLDDFLTASNNAVTLQSAIDGAGAGINVIIPPGTYYLTQPKPDDGSQEPWSTNGGNYAVGITKSNIKISGSGSLETRLISHNRSTIHFYLGVKRDIDGNVLYKSCTNTVIENIWFQGNPHKQFVISGGVKTTQTQDGALAPGRWDSGCALGYYMPSNFATATNHIVQNCKFTTADRFISALEVQKLWIRSNSFTHLDDINNYPVTLTGSPANTQSIPAPGVSIVSQGIVQNILITDNAFNGNPYLTIFPTNHNAGVDGFVWFQHFNGDIFISRNSILNYNLEGIQLGITPVGMSQNNFSTIANTGATVAFQLTVAYQGAGSWPITQFSMVGNVFNGGSTALSQIGLNGIGTLYHSFFNFSGNKVTFSPSMETGHLFPNSAVLTCDSAQLILSGNTVNASHGLRTYAQTMSDSVSQIHYVLNNDFSGADYRSVVLETTPGVQKGGLLYNNKFNRGLQWHLKTHVPDAWSEFLLNNQYWSGTNQVSSPVLEPLGTPVNFAQ